MQADFCPDTASSATTQLTAFMQFAATQNGEPFPSYWAFEAFAITHYPQFWKSFAQWSGLLRHGELEPVCVGTSCESARFFPSAHVNYADALLAGAPAQSALTVCHGGGQVERFSRGELRAKVARVAAWLRRLGVRPGDRVVAVSRHNGEVVIAALAASAIGATFSSCGLEMAASAILMRFAPLAPVVLLGNLRSEQWEHEGHVAARMAEVAAGLPSLQAVVAFDDGPMPSGLRAPLYHLSELLSGDADASIEWRPQPFDHPLLILFSSGTTGRPKCIVHGTGGTLLEHAKEHRLHCDLKPGDKLFYQTSPGWMMWNWQLSALASGVELVVYDGPLRGPETMWDIVARQRVTVFGTSATYLQYCQNQQLSPGKLFDLTALRSVLSTGSILYPQQFDWVHDHVKDVPTQSISGGSDIIGCFVLGNPNLPVHRGQAQCRSLGLDVRSLPPAEHPEANIGELICANPFPSRPVGFFGDADGNLFHSAYFSQNPGVWTHGDLIELTPQGGAVLHGRSDGILNIRGVRVGPGEIYAILQNIPEIVESMVVEQVAPDEPGITRLILLVVLRKPAVLDAELTAGIRNMLLGLGSSILLPACILQVDALPVTHNGKRSEAAARDALNGRPLRNREALQNPECLEAITNHPSLCSRFGLPDQSADEIEAASELERDLMRVCRSTLGVGSIGRRDNLFEISPDSLTTVALLRKIEERLKRPVTLETLVAAPTIESLLAADAQTANTSRRSGIGVRPTTPADTAEICDLLEHGFGNAADAWRPLCTTNWLADSPTRGFVLTDGGRIVGHVGTIYVQREINGKTGIVCNLSSWYVLPAYRAWAATLIAAALRDERITYTALTPVPVTQRVLEAMGFAILDRRMLLFPPGLNAETLWQSHADIDVNDRTVRASLGQAERQIYDDHASYHCLHMTARDAAGTAYLVVKRRLRRVRSAGIPFSQILYCSAPDVLARNLERIKLAIMWHQKTFVVAMNERLFPNAPRAIRMKDIAQYRSAGFTPNELDLLYSEFLLLEI